MNFLQIFLYNLRASRYYKLRFDKIAHHLSKSQYYNIDKLKKYQEMQIEKLNNHVRENNEYYKSIGKELTKKNILSGFIRLSKNSLATQFDKIYKKTSNNEYLHITSGSTGQPCKVITSRGSEAHRLAQRNRFYDWWKVKPDDRNVLIWGKLTTSSKTSKTIVNRIKERIKSLFFEQKTHHFSVFSLSNTSIFNYFQEIKKRRPKFIRGYTSGIHQFCSLLESSGLDGHSLGFKVAFVTSEILLENQRDYIQRILGCPVANEYGAAEVGLIAYDCEYQNLHICEELINPIIDEEGNLLITDLLNFSTPLINYEIGDQIVFSKNKCKCGRESRVIEKINGRTGDLIQKTDGSFISQYLFYYAIKDLDNMGLARSIKQYKVFQIGYHFDVYLIKDVNYDKKAIDFIKKRMKAEIGEDITIKIIFVLEIEKEKSGKVRFFKRKK